MADHNPNVVSADSTAAKLPDGVVDLNAIEPSETIGSIRRGAS
jgi:hypothetical protein